MENIQKGMDYDTYCNKDLLEFYGVVTAVVVGLLLVFLAWWGAGSLIKIVEYFIDAAPMLLFIGALITLAVCMFRFMARKVDQVETLKRRNKILHNNVERLTADDNY